MKDKDKKWAGIQLYIRLVHHLRSDPVAARSRHFIYLNKKAAEVKSRLIYQLVGDRTLGPMLKDIWDIVVYYRLYKSNSVRFDRVWTNFLKQHGLDARFSIEGFWRDSEVSQLLHQLQPDAWQTIIKRMSSKDLSSAAEMSFDLLADWQDSQQLAKIQQAIIDFWNKSDPQQKLIKAESRQELTADNIVVYVAHVLEGQHSQHPRKQTRKKDLKADNKNQQDIVVSQSPTGLKHYSQVGQSATVFGKNPYFNPFMEIIFGGVDLSADSILDKPCLELLNKLLSQSRLNQIEVNQLAQKHNISPTRLVNQINYVAANKFNRMVIKSIKSGRQIEATDLELVRQLIEQNPTS